MGNIIGLILGLAIILHPVLFPSAKDINQLHIIDSAIDDKEIVQRRMNRTVVYQLNLLSRDQQWLFLNFPDISQAQYWYKQIRLGTSYRFYVDDNSPPRVEAIQDRNTSKFLMPFEDKTKIEKGGSFAGFLVFLIFAIRLAMGKPKSPSTT